MSIRLIFLSFLCLLLFLILSVPAIAEEEPIPDTVINATDFFRRPIAVLWTYQGEGSESCVLQIRYGMDSSEMLPNIFGQLGLIPDIIVGDVIYESSPRGESGASIWSNATAHYDNLFGYNWLEGRVIYEDVLLDSYLGAGIGFSPIDNSWGGIYYLGSSGYLIAAEVAYPLGNEKDKWWVYAEAEYYTNDEWIEGEAGITFQETLWFVVQNRTSEWIYMMGISQSLE